MSRCPCCDQEVPESEPTENQWTEEELKQIAWWNGQCRQYLLEFKDGDLPDE